MTPSPRSLTISVVVNTCDRRDPLRTLLLALNHQTYPHFEVVVVLGPTNDDSQQMLEREFDGQVHVVRCPRFNLSVSRNIGLRHAAGEVVAFIDDDAVPSAAWLEQLAESYLAEPNVSGVGGRSYQIHPGTGGLQFLCGLVSVLADQDDVRDDPGRPLPSATPRPLWFPRLHGTNMSYRHQALSSIGGFDEYYEYLFDDADIGVRLGLSGHILRQLQGGVVYHVPQSGRNREVFTYKLNWYTWLRCTLYFALRNGRQSAGLLGSLRAALRHASHFYAHVDELRSRGSIPPDYDPKVRQQLRRGLLEGLQQGLFGPRQIPGRIERVERPFTPFPRKWLAALPALSPMGTPRERKVVPLEDKPLRVGLLSVGYPPHVTQGVARSTHVLAQGLAELGHEVHVVTRGDTDRVTWYEGAFVHQVRLDPSLRYRFAAEAGCTNLYWWLSWSHAAHEAVEAIRRNDALDLVDTPLWHMDGLVTAVSRSLPVVVRAVTAVRQISAIQRQATLENSLLGDLEQRLLDLASAIVSNSSGTDRTLREVYGLDLSGRVHGCVPYGIVPSPDSDVQPLDGAERSDPVVLFLGRLERRKGVLDLFEAIPQVLKAFPRARFRLVGADNSDDDGFRASHGLDYPSYFRKRYPAAAASVEFLGHVEDSRLRGLYRDCDVFVAPSIYESFGLIYLEAMDQARPVLACNAGGPTDVVDDGVTGLLVPPAAPPRLAEALGRLLGDAKARREMGMAGRERLLARFTHRHMAEGFVSVYRRLLR